MLRRPRPGVRSSLPSRASRRLALLLDVAGISEEIGDGSAPRTSRSTPRAARCSLASPSFAHGPTCRNSRAPPTAAIRASSSSSCAARSTVSRRGAGRRSRLRRPARLDRACDRRPASGAPLELRSSPSSGDAGVRAACIGEGHATVVHAVATGYRDRSHFDGQDVLESGYAGPGRVQSGWLNRALQALPRGERAVGALAVGTTTPLVLRGAAPTRRLGAGRSPAGRRRHRGTAARSLHPSRPRARRCAVTRPAAREKLARRRHEADARAQPGRCDAACRRRARPS